MAKLPCMLAVSAAVCALLSGCYNPFETAASVSTSTVQSTSDGSAGTVQKSSSPVTTDPEPSRKAASSVSMPAASSPTTSSPTTSSPTTSAPATDGSATGSAAANLADRPIPAASSSVSVTTLRVRPTSEVAPLAVDGVGAMRISCGYSHMAFDDPIVFPGKPGASHLHTFFANSSTDGNSTTESLFAAGSTCSGGNANRSAYWVPSMVDSATMRAVVPSSVLVYYKSGYNSIPLKQIQAPPNGLRVIAGNAVTQSSPKDDWDVWHYFECDGANRNQSIPACQGGKVLSVTVIFPNCWDGVNLDSVDHRSHMSYPVQGLCPASHPVAVPVVSLNVYYDVPNGESTANWRLSSDNYAKTIPAGYSMHADFWIDWDESIKAAWMDGCVRAGRDCHAHLVGDGREYY
ncbi:MAG: DUF1996 domain-containing protein [Steroidobacteraceae bacterium]